MSSSPCFPPCAFANSRSSPCHRDQPALSLTFTHSSISSSPLWNPSHATLTFSVLNQPSLSGQGAHIGVATSYLSSLQEHDTLHVAVRPSHPAFSMPASPESTPAIYIAAGSGLAPFRGFVQERAAMLSSGQRTLAPAVLFFGCRSPDQDDLYRAQLDEWEALGAVQVLRSYSRAAAAAGRADGCRHVDDVMWQQRARLMELWRQGAKIYVCGSRGVAEAVKEAIVKIKVEADGDEADEAATRKWFEGLRNIRYVMDVFD